MQLTLFPVYKDLEKLTHCPCCQNEVYWDFRWLERKGRKNRLFQKKKCKDCNWETEEEEFTRW